MNRFQPCNRRWFLKTAAAAALGFHFVPRHVLGGPRFVPPSEKVNIAIIGAGGQGRMNSRNPRWQRWMDFHREGYRRYLRRYVDALGASHPEFQVINTAGPHANAPFDRITEIPTVGPLTVAIRLLADPETIVLQPEARTLEFTRQNDRVIVTVPRLDLYDVLEIHE